MPWHQEIMKEAEDCQKLRGAVNQALIRRFPNGETRPGKPRTFLPEYIGQGRERRELKHLSSARKRKQRDSLSSGERNGNSPNLCCVIACKRCSVGVAGHERFEITVSMLFLFKLVELFWKGQPKSVTAA
ncbi:hypothetical protein CVU75_03890 [Candidatus Dependentiae bacterium HGW-Dependentiae-1]|nr:MAG: hypothetical protein CVU75_03890 [Candidatus Dependentiae bacterium HGW-Dependentiae-1]